MRMLVVVAEGPIRGISVGLLLSELVGVSASCY